MITGSRRTAARRGLGFLATLALVASCASIPQRNVVPEGVPSRFSHTGTSLNEDRWWEAFNDSTLTYLVEEMLIENLTLKGAYARIVQAEAVSRRERSARFPGVDIQGTASQIERSEGSDDETSFTLAGVVSYEVDLWGRIGVLSEAAHLDYQGSVEDYKAAALSLSAQIALTYFQLVEQVERLDVLYEQLDLNEQVLELVTLRFRKGQAGAADVLRQRQLVESTRGEIALAESGKSVSKHALNVLTGRPPEGVDLESALPSLPELPPLPDSGIPADLVTRRPDVRSAYLDLLAADRRAASAVAARFPRISVSAQGSTSGSAGLLFENWMTTLAGNLVMPLLDGGNRKSEADRAKAAATERFHAYGQSVLSSLLEVEDALVQETKQETFLASLRQQLDISEEVIRRTRASFAGGAATYLQVLDAVRTHQQLQRAVLSAHRDLTGFRIALYRAVAGGVGEPAPIVNGS